MAKFKPLTAAEARTMPRSDILARIEADSARWMTRPPKTDAERAASAETSRILHAAIDPAQALQAARDVLEGRPNAYWESVPEIG